MKSSEGDSSAVLAKGCIEYFGANACHHLAASYLCIEKVLSWWRLWCMALLDGLLRRHMYSWNELRFPILFNVFFSFLYPVIRDIGDISCFIV